MAASAPRAAADARAISASPGSTPTTSTTGSMPYGASACVTKRASSSIESSIVILSASDDNRGKTATTRPLRARLKAALGGVTGVTARVARALASVSPSRSGRGGPPSKRAARLAWSVVEARGAPLESPQGQAVSAVRLEQRGVGFALARGRVAHEEQVVPRRRRAHRRLADRTELADRAHLEVVGDDDAAVADLAAQEVLDDQAREGRGRVRRGIEAWVKRVRGHDAVHASLDRREEGRQVRRVHLTPVGVDDGQAQVGVHGSVALAREVLGAGGDAGRLEPADARGAVAGYEGRVLAVRADADVGAVALGQHVEHRREVHVYPEPAQLAAFEEPLAVDEVDFSRGARGQVVGEDGDGAAEHDDAPAFMIRRDQEPAAERFLEARQQAVKPLRSFEVAAVEHDACRLGLAEKPDVGLAQVGPRQPEHEAAPTRPTNQPTKITQAERAGAKPARARTPRSPSGRSGQTSWPP